MTENSSNLYTIPAGTPFAEALAAGLMKQTDNDPALLATYRILLPTRRACRNVQEAFLRLSEGKPLLLPRMQPLGDIDEEELSLEIMGSATAETLLDLPPTLSPIRRRILLAHIILGLPDFTKGPDQALLLADALARLMDQIYTESLDMGALIDLVPAEFARHWEITLEFLKILSKAWPAILAEQGVMDGADRRNHLIEALARHWQETPPQTPIIAAGSTGSIPATAALLKTIITLPQGCVILPGLDQGMDEQSWEALDDTHPQATLKHLLSGMARTRTDVHPWNNDTKTTGLNTAKQKARQWLTTELMRPADTAGHWQKLSLSHEQTDRLERSLDDIMRFDCATQQEEANLIALLMRETLEEPEKTATLVTPDRVLARRVAMACRRWGIEIDDSGGQSLNDTAMGSFIRLCAATCVDNLRPSSFLSLLKHRFFKIGQNQHIIENLELSLLRGPAPAGGFEGLKARLQEKVDTNKNILLQHPLIEDLEPLFIPLLTLCHDGHHEFTDFLTTHITLCESLAGEDPLWQGEEGEEAARFLADLQDQAHTLPPVTGFEYLAILEQFMSGISIRPAYGTHPRLSILGQLEARLLQADRVILGGLNEGTWPPEAAIDPWMSRPMKQKFGLPAPERSIGLAAHDFTQGFCAPHIVLTRAQRVDGTPKVPARWLQRLDTVLQAVHIAPLTLSAHPYLSLARSLDHSKDVQPCSRPEPRPPLEKRPRSLHVTTIEKWMRDPYHIYARYILKLHKLDPVEQNADAALRGTIVHDVLDRFITTHRHDLPDNAPDILRGMGRESLAAHSDDPALTSLWEPRFANLTQWFVDHEKTWRETAQPLLTESEGLLTLPDISFTLRARVDRIDRIKGGNNVAIIDYKTGGTPTKKDILAGYAPQIPLEGLIVASGGFKNIDFDTTIDYLGFWCLTGGAKPGEDKRINVDDYEELITQAHDGLVRLVEKFDDPQTPYYSLPRPEKAPPAAWQDYAHLARVQEWVALDDENAGEAA